MPGDRAGDGADSGQISVLVQELLAQGWFEAALFALLLLAALSILFYTLRTGVPPMPSSPFAREAMFHLIPEDAAPERIYELGCGWGGIAFELAARFPRAQVVAIELSPVPWLVCRLWAMFRRCPNLEIRRADFMKADLSEADLLLCYLMVAPMQTLARKLEKAARPGTLIVTNAFALPGWTAEETLVVPQAMHAHIYRYRVLAGAGAGAGAGGAGRKV